MTTPPALEQPRAIGTGRLSVKARDGSTHLETLHQAGSLKILFPRRRTDVQAIVVNTAGGLTGGDHFTLDATARPGASLSLTTQAAERVYRAHSEQTARVRTRLRVESGAQLHWLPQETILYDACALDRHLRVDLDGASTFLMVEPVLFGRQAMGEDPRSIRLDDRVEIYREHELIYRDGLHIWGDAAAQMDRPAIGNGARAMASLVLVRTDAEAHLSPLREILGPAGGASLLRRDVLVMRVLGQDGYHLRQSLMPALDRLTDHALPQSWRL